MTKPVWISPGVRTAEFPLAGAPTTSGRSGGNDVRIDPPTVPGCHARVDRSAGGFVATDRGSRDGTYVNGEKVARAVLRPTDRISLGSHVLVFKDPSADRRGDPEAVQSRPA